MKLLIDCQCLFTASQFRGIGNVCRNIVHELAGKTDFSSIKLLYNGLISNGYNSLTKEFPEIEKKNIIPFLSYNIDETKIGTKEYMACELLYVDAVVKSECNVLLIPSLFEISNFIIPPIQKLRNIITVASIVHDFIPLSDSDSYLQSVTSKFSYKCSLDSLSASDLILPISEYIKNKTEYLIPNGNIKKLLWGGYRVGYQANDLLPVDNITAQKYIFYSGGCDTRKNVISLLKAYSLCSDEIRFTYKLILAIGNSNFKKSVEKKSKEILGLSYNQCLILGYISENEMRWLYHNCRLFVFPSFEEGFGLTVLEAMQQDAPVICSNTTSMPEVHGYFSEAEFNPYDVNDIRNKIEYWCKKENNDILRKWSKKQSSLFNWRKTVECLTGYIKEIPDIQHSITDAEEYVLKNSSFLFPNIKDREKFASLLATSHSRTVYFDISSRVKIKKVTGIQRVVDKFIECMPNVLNVAFEYKCIVYENGFHVATIGANDMMTLFEEVHPLPGDYYVSVDLCPETIANNISELEKWQNNGCILCACVHDIGFILHPQYIENEYTINNLEKWLKTVLKHFDKILCVSNAVLQETIEYKKHNNIENDKSSFGYFHLGSDIISTSDSETINLPDVVKIRNLNRTNFISVSTIEPRKGYIELIDAFEKSLSCGLDANLIIVGRSGWKCNDIIARINNSSFFNKNIFWFSDCYDDKLQQLYAISDCYISASFYEGFGLGAVEAAKHKLPCILRDIPVFKEIGKENALYFRDINELSNCLVDFSKNKSKYSNRIIDTLTWKESVQMAFDFLLK